MSLLRYIYALLQHLIARAMPRAWEMVTKRLAEKLRIKFLPDQAGPAVPDLTISPHWLVLLSSVAVSAWLAVRLGQDINWDILNYHFYGGFAFLHKPFHYDFAPAQVQTFFNPLLHILSYLLLLHLPSRIVAALLGGLQGLNFYLVFQISQVLFWRWQRPYRIIIGLINAAGGFYGTISIIELGTTFGDNLGSLLILTGLLLVIRYLLYTNTKVRVSNYSLAIAGLLLGAAFGLKLTVVIYIIAIALAGTAFLIASKNRVRTLSAFFAGLLIGFVVTYGAWGASLYREYQNPVYPHMNNVFRSPYYDLENTMDARFLPRNWQEKLFYPFYFTRKNHLVSEIDFRDARLAACYVMMVLVAVVGGYRLFKRRDAGTDDLPGRLQNLCLLFLAMVFSVSYLIWQNLFSIYRYLIVLELLAPTFLALALAYFFRSKHIVLGIALALNLGICSSVIRTDFGRQRFDDRFLRIEIPQFRDLEKSVVLMVGEEATSFIVPWFPASTRFIRIASNFVYPGRNNMLDQKIRNHLSRYSADRTLIYLANAQETDLARRTLAYYGVTLDDRSCREVKTHVGYSGYLCRSGAGAGVAEPMPTSVTRSEPEFQRLDSVRLEITPQEALAGKDTFRFRVIGLKARAVDMLYTVDGEWMPPVRNWSLDKNMVARVPVGAASRKGLYHIVGLRDTDSANPNLWIAVDVLARIR